jgi:hypothetical protein
VLPGEEEPGMADEQMAFGFSTGDESVPDAYFYVTAYPWQDELMQAPLPEGARWQQEGWRGALLPYETLQQQEDPVPVPPLLLARPTACRRAPHGCQGGRARPCKAVYSGSVAYSPEFPQSLSILIGRSRE